MPKKKSSAVGGEKEKERKKTVPKKTTAKKKVKPVIVDVIEDEPLVKEVEETVTWPEFSVSEDSETEIETAKRDEDLDQQKKFFSELVSEIKEKKEPQSRLKSGEVDFDSPEKPTKKSLGLYRRLVWKFVILVLVLAALVGYFSFSTLTVNITPKGEVLNDNLFLKVSQTAEVIETDLEANDPRELIAGEIKEISSNVEKIYPASGEEYGEEEIIGQVKVINNYSKSQALVATTRLLSPDNKLFRLKSAVNVPAGGEVSAEIYTDKPSRDLAIGPTTFTIPGLWLGLQDKIFARSEEDFVYQQKIKKYVKPSDIEQATRDISDLLVQTAKNSLGEDFSRNWLYDTSSQASIEIGAKAGDFKNEFVVKAQGKIIAVSFSAEQVAKLAAAKLNLLVPDGKELIEFNPKNINYSLEDYEAKSGLATIKASFTGTMAPRGDSEIISRDRLVNLSEEQIDNYLKDFPEIKDYELKFSPSFVKKAPRLVDRIKIKINKE